MSFTTNLLTLAELFPTVILAFWIALALCIGSFLNVVIYRLPIMLQNQWRTECQSFLEIEPELAQKSPERFNLMVPRSRCSSCKSLIPAWCNIPLISWLILRGKCRTCKAAISIRYPLVELGCAILAFACYIHFGFSSQLIWASLFCWLMLSLALIDFDTMYLPDQITLPLLWLGLLLNLDQQFVALTDAVLGAAVGYMSLWCLFWVFKLLTGKEGMGYGDFKLFAVIGAWFGWQALPLTILLASAVGAIVGISLLLRKSISGQQAIPFGPYLAIAALINLFWGGLIVDWYLSVSGLV
ncbi:prepilin peptidase [Alginatibacterium sediminis]|uniref:Prepilin leader peptidase/N-methyltransferase n=1 Tax=Alginatibacterium sediminis TaxID=2164068 RepID=A0A420EJM4_9ALTE|nr:A24 family peptidase [Alginatibacterium sediminis]RKF20863.1 prepilin peptidase [Alginatibacterium sediminis]